VHDLTSDPYEQTNLADEPRHEARKREMEQLQKTSNHLKIVD
jgi:hypothetical protein